jgi:hypothetical protein
MRYSTYFISESLVPKIRGQFHRGVIILKSKRGGILTVYTMNPWKNTTSQSITV